MTARRLIILGIDPGTRSTGWGVVSLQSGQPRAVACDVITPRATLPIDQRLLLIFEAIREVIGRYSPDEMAVEEPFVGENVRSAMAVGQARTVAMLAGQTAIARGAPEPLAAGQVHSSSP